MKFILEYWAGLVIVGLFIVLGVRDYFAAEYNLLFMDAIIVMYAFFSVIDRWQFNQLLKVSQDAIALAEYMIKKYKDKP